MKYISLIVIFLSMVSATFSRPQISESPSYSREINSPWITRGGEDPDPFIRAKRNFIERMMKDSWDEYVRYAWGQNELKPVSQTGSTGGSWGNSKIGATIVDALGTLWIMGLTEEYNAGREYVAQELDFSRVNATVSVFETNIRFIGGFLSAYALSGDPIYMVRAYEIAKRLLPAFDTPTGIPFGDINILTGIPEEVGLSCLAAFGTLHLEFQYLSEITGDPIFANKVNIIRKFMKDIEKPKGLYANFLSPFNLTGEWASDFPVSMGAFGDSFYEYLLKASIQQASDLEGRQMYDEAMTAFINNGLVKNSTQNNLLYFAEMQHGIIRDEVGHLACFAGGMFALGAHVDPDNTNAARDAEIARRFVDTCHESYIRTQTKIGPEVFRFTPELEAEADGTARDYNLRPEVIESYFYMYRITGDSKYRDWGWEAAQSIEKYCKAGSRMGYSGIRNTNSTSDPQFNDVQETFFLAETLKYLYLLFSTDDLIDLKAWVFNTEAHPLPIKGVNPMF